MRTNVFARLAVLILFLEGCSFNEAQYDPAASSRALSLVDRGASFLEVGDLKRAEASFRLAMEIAPSTAAAVDGLGCVAFFLGNFEEAERDFLEAYNMDSNYNTSVGNLAILYEAEGKPEKAAEIYKQSISLDPADFRVRNNFAAHLADHGKKAQSLEHLLKAEALARNPLIDRNFSQLQNSGDEIKDEMEGSLDH